MTSLIYGILKNDTKELIHKREIAKTWKQPKCPSTDKWIKKMWYIYIYIYYIYIYIYVCVYIYIYIYIYNIYIHIHTHTQWNITQV